MMRVLFFYVGRAVCHQLPERSLYIGGYGVMPVCARCAGIYIGVFVAFCYLFIKKRLIGNKPVSFFCIIISVLSFLPLMVDGATSYLGLRDSSNALRLLTGLLLGYPLPVFFALLSNFAIDGENNRPIIQTNGEFIRISLLALAAGVCAYAGSGGIFGIAVDICLSLGICLVFFSVINILLRQLLSKMSIKKTAAVSLLLTAGVVGILSMVSLLLRSYIVYLY